MAESDRTFEDKLRAYMVTIEAQNHTVGGQLKRQAARAAVLAHVAAIQAERDNGERLAKAVIEICTEIHRRGWHYTEGSELFRDLNDALEVANDILADTSGA